MQHVCVIECSEAVIVRRQYWVHTRYRVFQCCSCQEHSYSTAGLDQQHMQCSPIAAAHAPVAVEVQRVALHGGRSSIPASGTRIPTVNTCLCSTPFGKVMRRAHAQECTPKQAVLVLIYIMCLHQVLVAPRQHKLVGFVSDCVLSAYPHQDPKTVRAL